jgi:cytochrome b subunit of formate dehydrogenase
MKVSLLSIKKITHWLLLALTLVYIISGLGILYNSIMLAITLGLLTKNLSFQIHNYLLIPFLAVLFLHIVFVIRIRKINKSE